MSRRITVVASAQISPGGVTHAMIEDGTHLKTICGTSTTDAGLYNERFYTAAGSIDPVTCRSCLQKLLNAPTLGAIP
jgi:hypothetical protein